MAFWFIAHNLYRGRRPRRFKLDRGERSRTAFYGRPGASIFTGRLRPAVFDDPKPGSTIDNAPMGLPAHISILRAIDGYDGLLVTKLALRLAPLVFVRPGELRQAEWSEVDLEGCEWRISAGK